MTRFASALAAAVLVLGLAAPPALARGGAPGVPQGLSIDSIHSGQPAPSEPMDDLSGPPGLRDAAVPGAAR